MSAMSRRINAPKPLTPAQVADSETLRRESQARESSYVSQWRAAVAEREES